MPNPLMATGDCASGFQPTKPQEMRLQDIMQAAFCSPLSAQSGYFDHIGKTEWERNQDTHFFIQAQSEIARFYAVKQTGHRTPVNRQLGRRLKPCFETQRSMEIGSDQMAANRQLAAEARKNTEDGRSASICSQNPIGPERRESNR